MHSCRLPGQTGLSHKILLGFALVSRFCLSEQVLQLFVAYSLLDILSGILKKAFTLAG